MRVVINDVSFAYGSRKVLGGVSGVVESSRVTTVVGPSGSGKSTLLAIVAGYFHQDAGSIVVEHANGEVRAPHPSNCVWVPQGANALGGRSVLDNAMLGALASGRDLHGARKDARTAIDAVRLAHVAEARARTLSGGELQRLSFARAIASGRELILADEPTASLDADSAKMIALLLSELAGTATILVATHDDIVVRAASSVIRLR